MGLWPEALSRSSCAQEGGRVPRAVDAQRHTREDEGEGGGEGGGEAAWGTRGWWGQKTPRKQGVGEERAGEIVDGRRGRRKSRGREPRGGEGAGGVWGGSIIPGGGVPDAALLQPLAAERERRRACHTSSRRAASRRVRRRVPSWGEEDAFRGPPWRGMGVGEGGEWERSPTQPRMML